MILISGDKDRRVTREVIEKGIKSIKSTGTEIEVHFVEKEDHFLLFSQPELVVGLLSRWFAKVKE